MTSKKGAPGPRRPARLAPPTAARVDQPVVEHIDGDRDRDEHAHAGTEKKTEGEALAEDDADATHAEVGEEEAVRVEQQHQEGPIGLEDALGEEDLG